MWCAGLDKKAFRDLPLEVRIRLASNDCLGWRYGSGTKTRFPASRPMLPQRLVDPNGGYIDCSSFTSYVMATVFPDGHWTRARYAELQIFDAERPWSPLSAVEYAGVGSRIPGPVKGAWALCQAWVDASTRDGDSVSGGHARIVYCDPEDEDQILVLESTSRSSIGPRWTRTRFSALRSRYPGGVRLAALGPG